MPDFPTQNNREIPQPSAPSYGEQVGPETAAGVGAVESSPVQISVERMPAPAQLPEQGGGVEQAENRTPETVERLDQAAPEAPTPAAAVAEAAPTPDLSDPQAQPAELSEEQAREQALQAVGYATSAAADPKVGNPSHALAQWIRYIMERLGRAGRRS